MPELWELRPHLSHNSLRRFRRCPEQFRRNYLLSERGRPSSAVLVGRAIHAAIAHDLGMRLQGERATPTSVAETARERWLTDLEQNGGVDEVDWGKDGLLISSTAERKLLATKTIERAVGLASLYHSAVCPGIRPVAVEEEFSFELAGCPVPIIGFIDCREESGMREFKTASQSKKAMPGDWQVQGRIYQLVHPLDMEWDVLLKQASPKVLPGAHRLAFSEALAEATRRMVLNTVAQIEWCWATFGLERPWPDAVDNEWACGYCAYGPVRGTNDCYYHGGNTNAAYRRGAAGGGAV